MSSLFRGRVLIVEDDIRIAAGLKELLERYLYAVRVANTVDAAYQELVLDQFDVLVLDWILPDGDGRAVISFCHQVSPTTSVVVSSAHRSSDGECTPLADEFVEKGPDVMPLRNAVERAIRLTQERRAAIPSLPIDLESFNIAATAWRILKPTFTAEDHFCVTCESEPMGAAVARYVGSQFIDRKERTVVEVDAKYLSAREVDAKLFGEVRLSPGRLPELRTGLLDRGRASFLIVRNADTLPQTTQESLAKSVATGTIRRLGSNREILSNVRLAVTQGERQKGRNTASLGVSLKRLIGKRMLDIPAPSQLKGGAGTILQEVRRARCATETSMNPGEIAIVEQGNWGHSWERLFPNLKSPEEHCRDSAPNVSMIPLVETSFFHDQEGAQQIAKWKDVEDIPKALYVCRVLGITRGNVTDAVELSGIRRNTIYDVLKTYSLTAEQFRETPETRT